MLEQKVNITQSEAVHRDESLSLLASVYTLEPLARTILLKALELAVTSLPREHEKEFAEAAGLGKHIHQRRESFFIGITPVIQIYPEHEHFISGALRKIVHHLSPEEIEENLKKL